MSAVIATTRTSARASSLLAVPSALARLSTSRAAIAPSRAAICAGIVVYSRVACWKHAGKTRRIKLFADGRADIDRAGRMFAMGEHELPREGKASMIELKAYQGLIRNHAQLAAELGVDIDGLSRREREEKLLVAAYEKWGSDMGLHINGQFALALYDADADELFLSLIHI